MANLETPQVPTSEIEKTTVERRGDIFIGHPVAVLPILEKIAKDNGDKHYTSRDLDSYGMNLPETFDK